VANSGPTVIGTAAVGKLLTGLSGTWAGFSAISYHFQWHRCNAAGAACVSVHGATSPSYRLGEKDVGQTLGLTVLATDTTGTATASSSLIGPIAPRRPLLESTAQPVVAGPPVQGKIVQVTTGTWSPVPAKLAYRWERCNASGRSCAAIPRATGTSYTVSGADLGHALLAIVQAANGTTIQNAFSTATPAVVPGTVKGPAPILGPTVGGYAVVGQQLAADPGIWKGVGPTSFAYKWYRCDENGAHCALAKSSPSSTYPVTAKDAGRTIALTVRVTDSTGSKVAYASLVGPAADAGATLTPTSVPTISGTARVGGALSIATGVWSAQPSAYKTTWLRCNANGRLCSPIAGATRASYNPTPADAGHTLVASVVASSGGLTQAALTAATAPIT
jgi:large repetitive protein